MLSPAIRTEKIKLRKDSAAIYTLVGIIWAGAALASAPPALKNAILLGIAVPVLLLVARWILIQREYLDIHALWEAGKHTGVVGGHRSTLALAFGIFITMLIAGLVLLIAGKREWIAPSAAVLFALHFYLLPSDLSRWEDILIASAAAVTAIITPFWFPAQFWLWWLAASSACALACWMAADLRFEEALSLQEEERRETDRAAFNP